MTRQIPSGVHELDRLLQASVAEAERLVPELLALPGPLLVRELGDRPELLTPGVMKLLLAGANEAFARFPSRSYEIALAVARYAGRTRLPGTFSFVSQMLRGEAWRELARALRETGRRGRAVRAIRIARKYLEDTPGCYWNLATVDLVQARLLHDGGRREEALRTVRNAAQRFSVSRDDNGYVEARMTESSMLWAAGDRRGAGDVWNATSDAARSSGSKALMARLATKMGIFELRHGSAQEARRLLSEATKLFDAGAEPSEDAARARWHLAEAAAACGRPHDAISEYHKVRNELLEWSSLMHAAIAAVQVLDLYLNSGRERELPPLTGMYVEMFREAGLRMNVLEGLAYLRGRAQASRLVPEDLILVRGFFEHLLYQPNARFRAFQEGDSPETL